MGSGQETRGQKQQSEVCLPASVCRREGPGTSSDTGSDASHTTKWATTVRPANVACGVGPWGLLRACGWGRRCGSGRGMSMCHGTFQKKENGASTWSL